MYLCICKNIYIYIHIYDMIYICNFGLWALGSGWVFDMFDHARVLGLLDTSQRVVYVSPFDLLTCSEPR